MHISRDRVDFSCQPFLRVCLSSANACNLQQQQTLQHDSNSNSNSNGNKAIIISTNSADRQQRNSDVLLPAAFKKNELFPALKHF